MSKTAEGSAFENILERLTLLERRMETVEDQLERVLGHQPDSREPAVTEEDAAHREEELENRIGGNWFAKGGITALIIGIAFLLTFPYQGFPPVAPSLLGYLLVAATLVLARSWRQTYPSFSVYLQAGALILLFFTTLRLHFFSPTPPVTDRLLEFFILLAVVTASFVVAIRSGRQFLFALCVTAGYITALIGSESMLLIPLCIVLILVSTVIAIRRGWLSMLLYATVLTYGTHTLWVLNNPILGNPIALVPYSLWNTIPLLLYILLLAGGILFRHDSSGESGWVIANSFVNAIGGGSLYFLLNVVQGGGALAGHQTAAAIVVLVLALVFWQKERSTYSTFFYAAMGFLSMSASIVAWFQRPDYFIWLAWQSLLVVSMAVWFRSQFLVIANFILYLILFAAYAITAETVHVVSISYGVVAVATARILNWQKERLELKTEMMRNAYLACAFFIFPYALYHALPRGYVSISWIGIALFYYAMSILVKSRKYRWMAFLTVVLTIGRVLLVDSVSLEPAYRILSFLVLGIVMLLISLRYAKRRSAVIPGGTEKETLR